MIEIKKSGLSIVVESTKLVGDVAVGICFPLECSGCTLMKLKGCSSCGVDCFPEGSEESALGYSLYLAVNEVLCGNPSAVSKSKVGDVRCVSHNGMFGINWNVKGTGSAVRKSIGLALNALDPVKCIASYTRCIKQLNNSFNREAFNYVADKANSSIKSSTQITCVGNLKTDDSKLKDIFDVIVKKHDVTQVSGSKSKPSVHTACDHSNITTLQVSGWQSAVVSDYIRTALKGLVPIVCDKELLLPIKPSQWATNVDKLKKLAKPYAINKYSKVGSDLPGIFGYMTLSSGQLCASDVKSAIASNMTSDKIETVITKHL